MNNEEAQLRIEELERRMTELEVRPPPMQPDAMSKVLSTLAGLGLDKDDRLAAMRHILGMSQDD